MHIIKCDCTECKGGCKNKFSVPKYVTSARCIDCCNKHERKNNKKYIIIATPTINQIDILLKKGGK